MITKGERNGFHYIPDKDHQPETNMSISLEQAHKRFGHASIERLKRTPMATEGIEIEGETIYFCDSCAQEKSRRQPFPHGRQTRPTRNFEIVSSDLKGPILVPSKDGHRYYITFNCLYSTWCWITYLKEKTAEEVIEATKRFIADAQSETGNRLTTFLTDNGSEYVKRK
jgi:hypothetical protein